MPQLVPFYWVNQISYGFVLFSSLIYLSSQKFLPIVLRTYTTRLFLS